MTRFTDLRQWIGQAKEISEMVVVEGADLKHEIGTINQLTARNAGPSVLHQNIKGYPPGYRLLTNLLSNIRTFNLTIGFPIDNTIRDTVETLRIKVKEWETVALDLSPKAVEAAPIQENVLEDEDIDLNKFPVPLWHELDGGPYLGTADAIITRDPDTGEINAGTYRCQLYDRRTVGLNVAPGRHGRIHVEKYFERGEACPIVAVFGIDPLLFAVASNQVPQGVSELNYVGAIMGKPVPVIKGRVTGLPIPANAEIAIEGFVDLEATRREGPFGEFTGYYGGGETELPFIRAVTLYHRNDPILTGSPPAKGLYCDEAFSRSIWKSAFLYNELLAANVPGIKGVWFPPHYAVVSIKQLYAGHATQAGHITSQASTNAFFATANYTIVVDDDIDPYDFDDVMWAVGTRSRPDETDLIKKARTSRAEPTIRKPAGSLTISQAIIYAVKPFEWRHDFPPTAIASDVLRRKVFDKWKDTFKGRWQAI